MAAPPPHRGAPIPGRLTRIHLCTGLLQRDGEILLVASRYPNHPQPLWNLPGGRQHLGELLPETLKREFREETSLEIEPGALLYVSESYDGDIQFTNTTFLVTCNAAATPRLPEGDAHVVDLEWVPASDAGARITVRVVREPLMAFLAGDARRYYGYADAGISIEFAD